jgi:type IV secretory pathway TraG/TraD family ATPase VirD4
MSAVWNVFAEIDTAVDRDGADAAVRMAIKISESLIITPPGDRSPFFPNAARGVALSTILFVYRYCPREEQNLVTFRRLICRGLDKETSDPKEAIDLWIYVMAQCEDFGGAIANGAAALKNAGPDTLGNVLATLREQTKWIDLPELHPVLTGPSSFLSHELKTRDDLVVSLVAPVGAIREELAPFCRLLTNIIAHTFETLDVRKRRPCLFAIDELPAQGYNRTLETIAPVARSYGLQLLGIAQDIGNLRAAYPQTWESYIGNADAVFFMGCNHAETISYLEKALGTTSHREQVDGAKNPIERERPLLYAEQCRRFLNPARNRVIVTRAGKRPLRLKIATYYDELPVTAYDPDPDHREAVLRRIVRFVIAWATDRKNGGTA